ncbi:MAG: hypothetical protein HND58_05095 [Planctomycetota bacterium]|nr:MAG: hypothetical protein HND58_05095 [Planctomycetota bacterium]
MVWALPEKSREVLVLRFVVGMTGGQIGMCLRMSPGRGAGESAPGDGAAAGGDGGGERCVMEPREQRGGRPEGADWLVDGVGASDGAERDVESALRGARWDGDVDGLMARLDGDAIVEGARGWWCGGRCWRSRRR